MLTYIGVKCYINNLRAKPSNIKSPKLVKESKNNWYDIKNLKKLMNILMTGSFKSIGIS